MPWRSSTQLSATGIPGAGPQGRLGSGASASVPLVPGCGERRRERRGGVGGACGGGIGKKPKISKQTIGTRDFLEDFFVSIPGGSSTKLSFPKIGPKRGGIRGGESCRCGAEGSTKEREVESPRKQTVSTAHTRNPTTMSFLPLTKGRRTGPVPERHREMERWEQRFDWRTRRTEEEQKGFDWGDLVRSFQNFHQNHREKKTKSVH